MYINHSKSAAWGRPIDLAGVKDKDPLVRVFNVLNFDHAQKKGRRKRRLLDGESGDDDRDEPICMFMCFVLLKCSLTAATINNLSCVPSDKVQCSLH